MHNRNCITYFGSPCFLKYPFSGVSIFRGERLAVLPANFHTVFQLRFLQNYSFAISDAFARAISTKSRCLLSRLIPLARPTKFCRNKRVVCALARGKARSHRHSTGCNPIQFNRERDMKTRRSVCARYNPYLLIEWTVGPRRNACNL